MKNHPIHMSRYLIIALLSMPVFAADTISISVTTTEKSAAALGYSVDGKRSGGPGKSYLGKGPRNKMYSFGYRKNSVKGVNVACGTLILTQDSRVTLTTNGNKCTSVRK